jgi:5'-3' exonuclease
LKKKTSNEYKQKQVTKTLLVDGNNLVKIGFHGVKDYYHNGKHIGALWHFVNTIRRFIDEQNFDKVVVMWDGDDNSSARKLIYPQYKEQRRDRDNEYKLDSFTEQKERIKQYLEDCYIRQINVDNNEADDLIAYYCQISENEQKTIYSGDKDLTQLISDRVSVFYPRTKQTYHIGSKIKCDIYEFPHENIRTYKILSGDKSDNIDGISGLGEKTLIKFFPELLEKPVSITDILEKAEILLKENKDNKTLQNLLSGKTKSGVYGDEFFVINEKIINLSNPLITDDAKELVELYYRETLDPDGRGHRGLIKMMMEDGFFKYLPKGDDAWVNFVRPFMKLTRKEKRNYNNN